jgi:hypothetical protein
MPNRQELTDYAGAGIALLMVLWGVIVSSSATSAATPASRRSRNRETRCESPFS